MTLPSRLLLLPLCLHLVATAVASQQVERTLNGADVWSATSELANVRTMLASRFTR